MNIKLKSGAFQENKEIRQKSMVSNLSKVFFLKKKKIFKKKREEYSFDRKDIDSFSYNQKKKLFLVSQVYREHAIFLTPLSNINRTFPK